MKVTNYPYVDEYGTELYRKVRTDYPEDGHKEVRVQPAGYEGKRVLLGLPQVLKSDRIVIVEGEKCAEYGNSLNIGWYFTTSGSCNSWLPEFARYLKGKHVVVMPDNDVPGERYCASICPSLSGWAESVAICRLPDLPNKGDICDSKLSASEIAAELEFSSVPFVQEVPVIQDVFQRPSEIEIPEDTDWIVENAIERGTNGLLYSEPKNGKSWVSLDLALHVSNGKFWFGRWVPKDCIVGVLSREDADSITRRRIRQLATGNGLDEDRLLIAVRSRLYEASLDNPAWVAGMTSRIQDRGLQFAVWDIFNRFHTAEENNNTEVRKVLDVLDNITVKTKCNHLLIHHTTKASKSPRGASCIDGWAEFRLRLDWANKQLQRRALYIDGKSTEENKPIVFSIEQANGGIILKQAQMQQQTA